jgi:2-aminoadipate transaminase
MKFANRIERMKDKELLSLMELSEATGIISFSGGFPSPDTYPIEDIKNSFLKVFEEDPKGALSYSSTSGYVHLREQISARMKKNFDVEFEPDQVIVTSGSQQALDMAGLLLVDKGDVVLFETPSYLGALNALKAYEAQLVAVPTDDGGIVIDELEKVLDIYGDRVKMIYVIPDFQNPTGRCWNLERRKAFMALMAQHDVAIVEDAAYSELSFKTEKERPLISFDSKGQVIYCGTFSKTFCPGLRIGWICASKPLIEHLLLLKSNVDLSSPAITQRQTAYYLAHYDLDEHIRKNLLLYKKRRDLMLDVISSTFPKEISYNKPMGGLFIWLALPEGKDSRELLRRALAEKVAFVPGGSFYPGAVKNNEMRINFSNMSEEDIVTGITRLGKLAKEYLAEQ